MFKRIKKKLVVLYYYLSDLRYRKIKKSGLFDATYYLTLNPDAPSPTVCTPGNNNAAFNITPETKVGDLLDNYPDIEELLISLSPSFKKLRIIICFA